MCASLLTAVAGYLINTPLQWGARRTVQELNRFNFNGLSGAGETVETSKMREWPV
jgi:hypothetical protein